VHKRPTLVTVAQAAGVSRQTVSNVINSPARVQPRTRDRVQAVIDDLRYRPSSAARQLRTQRSRTLGLRLEEQGDGINGSVLDRFLHAVVAGAQEADYRVLLYVSQDDAAESRAHAELVDTAQVDAFILTGTHHGDPRTRWLTERRIPFSVFGRPWGEPSPVHAWVDIDGAAGTRAATEHLLAGGHRRIAFVGWPPGSGVGDDRRSGWRQALEAAGLPLDGGIDDAEQACADSVEAGEHAAQRLLTGSRPPTALVCASDSLALGALPVARAAGCAVVGFDDTPVAEAIGLSSVRQPLVEAAHAVLRHVLNGIDNPGRPPEVDFLTPELVVRASSRAP